MSIKVKVMIICGGAMILAIGVIGTGQFVAASRARTTSEVSLPIENPPEFLTDPLALQSASNALVAAGLGKTTWRPHENRRTTAPNGRPDVYLLRNQMNQNSGTIQFLGESAADIRIVFVELKHSNVVCRISIPK